MSKMQLLVNVNDITITLDTTLNATINNIKHLINEETDIPIDKQKLFFSNKPLQDDTKTLKDYHIINLSVITVHISISKNTDAPIQSSSFNLHAILSLIISDNDPYNIFMCDSEKPLIKIIQESEIMSSFPDILYCKISITTLDTYPDEITLNHDEIHTQPLHKIHTSIRLNDGIKVYIEYEDKFLYLIPRQYHSNESNDTESALLGLLCRIVHVFKSCNDAKLLKMASKLISKVHKNMTRCKVDEDSVRDIRNKIGNGVMPGVLDALSSKRGLSIDTRDVLLDVLYQLTERILHCEFCLEHGGISKLDATELIHPCTESAILSGLVKKVYSKFCRAEFNILTDIKDEYAKDWTAVRHLVTLLFYEEDDDIMKQAMKCLIRTIDRHASSIEDIQHFVYALYDEEMKIPKFYQEKQDKMQLLFSGYISMNINLISNDVACTIFDYFNCYTLNEYDFVKRLLFLFDINHGYDQEMSDLAMTILQRITQNCDEDITKLLVSDYDILTHSRKILKQASPGDNKFWFVSNIACDLPEIYDSDLMGIMAEAAVEIMSDISLLMKSGTIIYPLSVTICSIPNEDRVKNIMINTQFMRYVMKLMQDIMNQNLQFIDMLENMITTDNLLNHALNLVSFVLGIDQCTDLCLQQMKDIGLNVLNRIKDRDAIFEIDDDISTRAINLIDLYFNNDS